jgi:hypothetical protein
MSVLSEKFFKMSEHRHPGFKGRGHEMISFEGLSKFLLYFHVPLVFKLFGLLGRRENEYCRKILLAPMKTFL